MMITTLLFLFRKRIIIAVLIYTILILVVRGSVEIFAYDLFPASYTSYRQQYPNIAFAAFTLEFLTGFLAYWLTAKIRVQFAPWLIILGVLVFLSGMLFIDLVRGGQYLGGYLQRAAFFGFSSALIIVGLVRLEKAGKILIPGLFAFLGNASYSIYLLHIPVFLVFFKVVMKFRGYGGNFYLERPLLSTILAIFLLLVLSSLNFICIEQPLHNQVRRLIMRLSPRSRNRI